MTSQLLSSNPTTIKLLQILVEMFLFINVSAQTGTITGNVFYKYNDFVGNRGDAGSDVFVINKGNIKYKSKSDINGNFKIENFDTGYYSIVIRSKATTDDPEIGLMNFTYLAALLKLKVDDKLEISIRENRRIYDSLNLISLQINTYAGKPKEREKAISEKKAIDDLKTKTYSKMGD